jgi:flagellar basal-body rod modification protein FlgD
MTSLPGTTLPQFGGDPWNGGDGLTAMRNKAIAQPPATGALRGGAAKRSNTDFARFPQPAGAVNRAATGQTGLPSRAQSSASAAATANAASTGTATSDPSASSATISANDFLTLLVTELQNQDPTAQTDPNEYINQLVGINSLEQLISINQNLAAVLGAASSTTPAPSATDSAQAGGMGGGVSAAHLGASRPSPAARSLSEGTVASSVPGRSDSIRRQTGAMRRAAAAQTVGHALDGHRQGIRSHPPVRDIPTHLL